VQTEVTFFFGGALGLSEQDDWLKLLIVKAVNLMGTMKKKN